MICLAFNICICVTSVQAHDKMLVLTHDETELSLDSKVLIFRFRWIQEILAKCRLLASSGAECRPGAHSDVQMNDLNTWFVCDALKLANLRGFETGASPTTLGSTSELPHRLTAVRLQLDAAGLGQNPVRKTGTPKTARGM